MTEDTELKSKMDGTISDRPRDDEGQFVSSEEEQEHQAKDPISKYFSENIHYSRNKDDLLDVHVGNPLRRIAELLEQIKKQKAFSFTLKGSLGLAGVFLALSIFGFLGGGRMLCDKGAQSKIGVIKILNIQERESSTEIPVLSQFLDFFAPRPLHPKTILVNQDATSINVPFSSDVNFRQYENLQVVATGNYNACSQTLKVSDPSGIEIYFPTR